MPPMPPDFLQQLLARRDTWWGRESTGTGQGQSTGFNDLDQILAGGGWPEQGLVELLCPLPCPLPSPRRWAAPSRPGMSWSVRRY